MESRWGRLAGIGDALDGAVDGLAAQVYLIEDEVVWRLRFHVPRFQSRGREVFEVVGHDHLCPRSDRRRKHMAVVRVWQFDRLDEGLIPRHQAVADRRIQEAAGASKSLGIEVGSIGAQSVEDLIEDPVRPLCLDQPSLSDSN